MCRRRAVGGRHAGWHGRLQPSAQQAAASIHPLSASGAGKLHCRLPNDTAPPPPALVAYVPLRDPGLTSIGLQVEFAVRGEPTRYLMLLYTGQ